MSRVRGSFYCSQKNSYYNLIYTEKLVCVHCGSTLLPEDRIDECFIVDYPYHQNQMNTLYRVPQLPAEIVDYGEREADPRQESYNCPSQYNDFSGWELETKIVCKGAGAGGRCGQTIGRFWYPKETELPQGFAAALATNYITEGGKQYGTFLYRERSVIKKGEIVRQPAVIPEGQAAPPPAWL